jgi:hypothetical protein
MCLGATETKIASLYYLCGLASQSGLSKLKANGFSLSAAVGLKEDMGGLIAVGGQVAVLILKLDNLEGTAAALNRVRVVVAGMDMIEDVGAVAADDDAGVAAVGVVVGAVAGGLEQVVFLASPGFGIVGAIDGQPLPNVDE